MLERYNSEMCTFFTPREMGFVLHEMYGLAIGDLPYEEYVPSVEELLVMEEVDPLVYAMYWKLLCHFHICAETTSLRSGRVRQISWVSYLFKGLKDKADQLSRLAPITVAEIKERISVSTTLYTTKYNEDTFKPGTIFESFHYQAKTHISNRALLAGFLSCGWSGVSCLYFSMKL